MEENFVTIPLDDYAELISIHTRYHIIMNAIKDRTYVTESYDHLNDTSLLDVLKAIDPSIRLHIQKLREELNAKKENNG